MIICVISASMRANSQSKKVAEYLKERIESFENEASVLDLHELKLPPYDDEGFGNNPPHSIKEIRTKLSDADGYVLVCPEWDGMMSYGLINMLLYIKHEMAHKPVMLVGVSSGRGGTYPVAQMKMLGQKNKHYVLSPENLIVSHVKSAFNNFDLDPSAEDYLLKQRADYALKILLLYAENFHQIRSSDLIDFEQFPNGV